MRSKVAARIVFAVTALTVFVGMIVQLHVSAGLKGTQFASVGSRLVNVFCYFTVQSNVIVGVTTLLLALRVNRPSTVFRAFRLAGLVGITITFVVFHIALAHLQELQGSAAFADLLLHTVAPLLTVLGWLLFGPREHSAWRIPVLSLLFPLAWTCLALIRGPIVDFYAYPFADPRRLGYPRVLLNGVLIAALFLALAMGAVRLGRRLPGSGRTSVPRKLRR